MNDRERKYHKWTMVISLLYLFAAGVVWMISIPAAVSRARIILHCAPTTILALGFALTVAIHQIKGRLVRGVMIPQIVLTFLTFYGIPLGIWGIRLLSAQSASSGGATPASPSASEM